MKAIIALLVGTLALSAEAENLTANFGLNADVVPLSLSFRKALADDVGTPSYFLRAAVVIKNIGRLAVVPGTGVHSLALGSRVLRGRVYGPASRGGVLGDKLFQGETGLFMVELKLGDLLHCSSLRVHIDVARDMQSGDKSVFLNDTKMLTAIDSASIRPCLAAPLPVSP